LLRAVRAAGIRAVRNPFEPAWSCRATPVAPLIRRIEVDLLRPFERAFHRIVAEEGFTTTNGALGILATGTLDATTVASLLKNMPPGVWELVMHPGYNDADLNQAHTRLKASRETELNSLLSAQSQDNPELVSFADLADGTASS
jgi:YdjC-like protein